MKKRIALAVLVVVRMFVRYFPVPIGKRWVYDTVIDRHLAWRPFGTTARMRAGPRLHVQLPDQIQSRVYFFGTWEPEISDYISRALSPGDCFIDVGANVGYFTLMAASIVGKQGVVHSIEASPSIFAVLSRNVAINGFSNVSLHHKAVSNERGSLSIFLAPATNRGATTTVPSVARRKHQALEAEVEADTLSSIVGVERLLTARLIKIDVEGAECSVLHGIAHLLSKFSPATEWLIEISPDAIADQGQSTDALLAMFRACGYVLYRVRNDYSDESYFRRAHSDYLEELRGSLSEPGDLLARRPAPH